MAESSNDEIEHLCLVVFGSLWDYDQGCIGCARIVKWGWGKLLPCVIECS